jgi:hypothetical protein
VSPTDVATWVERSRASQGLAAKVTDEDTLLQVAGLFLATVGRTSEGDG